MAGLFLCAVLVGTAMALEVLPTPSFTWDFAPGNNTNNLVSCGTYSLLSNGNSSLSGGPFTLRAFSPNVTPVYMDVGTNATRLQWQVPLPPDIPVMLDLVDANGTSGEVKGPITFNGSLADGSCRSVNVSTPSFRATVANKSPIGCAPFQISISGGSPPYTATIVIEGVGIISRSMNGQDDIYSWVNVAPSGTRVIFSAVDRMGNLAASSNIITSTGDSTNCSEVSYSYRSGGPGSSVGHIFELLALCFPISIVAFGLIVFLTAMFFYGIFLLLRRWAMRLYRATRCGDEESGSDGVDTRPHTPVEQDRPGTPPMGVSSNVAPIASLQPITGLPPAYAVKG